MEPDEKIDLIQQVMGASHVFCSAVSELLERALQETTDEQLAMSQIKLLLLIDHPHHNFKVTEVAEFLGVTNAAASRAIDRLVQRGLVDRTTSLTDRRAVDLALTPAGRDLLARFSEVRNQKLMQLLGDYPEDKLRLATELIDQLSVRLLDTTSAPDERCLRCGVHFRTGCVVKDVLGRECVVSSQLYGHAESDGH